MDGFPPDSKIKITVIFPLKVPVEVGILPNTEFSDGSPVGRNLNSRRNFIRNDFPDVFVEHLPNIA